MVWRYSGVQHGPVWLDSGDYDEHVTDCDECGEEFDLELEGDTDGDNAFCEVCFNNIFGGK